MLVGVYRHTLVGVYRHTYLCLCVNFTDDDIG